MTKIAAIQMDIALGDKDKNLNVAIENIKEACRNNARIVCLPELFNTGYLLEEIHLLAEDEGKGETLETLCNIAREEKIIILAGSIAVKRKDGIFNTTYVINRDGKIEGSYDKIHLFPVMNENKYFSSGNKLSVVEISPYKIGLMICYDIRFPEIARILSLNGAELLFVPSEFPNPRLPHWKILLSARAIENQLYVVGVNRIGSDKTSSYFGNSMIVDPWGEVISQAGDTPEIIYGEIKTEKIKKVREKIPCFQDRREDVYSISGKFNTY